VSEPAPSERSGIRLARAEDVDRELGARGAQRAYRVGAEDILLVRGRDRVLRCFHNVCRHRGHELLPPGDTRTANAIKCPYHAWVYALDGRLAGASRFGDQPSFDRDAHPLVQVPVREEEGWLVIEP
jgi:glycine betaine catabolism A